MSEVKHELCPGTYVKVAEVIQWTDPHTRKSMQHRVHFYREATPAEIMEAHPKCKDCSSNSKEEFGIPWCYVRDGRIADENTDYCCSWEVKP